MAIYSCTEKMDVAQGQSINILTTNINVFNLISKIHDVPYDLRYTENFVSDYQFKWQSGLGCPWVIEKEKGTYNSSSYYMINVFNHVAPILLSLNIKANNNSSGS